VVGRPGLGKTESLKAALRGQAAYYVKAGRLTPLQFHKDCYYHRPQPIVLDDAEHLLDDKIGAKQIGALGDTSEAKQMNWGSTTRALGDVPQSYYTTSPLCILANRGTAREDIQSRAIPLYFDPTNLEIHRAVARWYWDQEIHDWFGTHLSRLKPLDVRWYIDAADDKRCGRDWRQIILTTRSLDKVSCIVQDLETDPAHPTREDKAMAFRERLAGEKRSSERTYYRIRKRLEEDGRLVVQTVPPIRLTRLSRPATPTLLELDAMAAPPPPEPEPEPGPADLPAGTPAPDTRRADFERPPRPQPRPPQLPGDTLAWERRASEEEDQTGDE
jgi:hypothetical protein